MRNWAAITLVFGGGFIIMVLEIIGARYLAKDFGGAFYVWISQIGVILIAGVLRLKFRDLLERSPQAINLGIRLTCNIYNMLIRLRHTGTRYG